MYAGKTVEELSEGLTMYPQDLINVRLTAGLDVTRDEKVQAVVAEVEKELGSTGRYYFYANQEPSLWFV